MWPSQDGRGEEHQDLNEEDKTSRVRRDTCKYSIFNFCFSIFNFQFIMAKDD